MIILTGSFMPKIKSITHSGTGRILSIKMSTMSLYETGDSDGKIYLYDITKGNFKNCLTKNIDLKIYADTLNAKLYHYQDYKNNEIDAVIELDDASWCACEIKLGANQIDEAAKKLLKIKKDIENSGNILPKVMGIICALTNAAYLREDGIYVIPFTSFKN